LSYHIHIVFRTCIIGLSILCECNILSFRVFRFSFIFNFTVISHRQAVLMQQRVECIACAVYINSCCNSGMRPHIMLQSMLKAIALSSYLLLGRHAAAYSSQSPCCFNSISVRLRAAFSFLSATSVSSI